MFLPVVRRKNAQEKTNGSHPDPEKDAKVPIQPEMPFPAIRGKENREMWDWQSSMERFTINK